MGEELLEHGVNKDTNTIVLVGEIEEDASKEIIRAISTILMKNPTEIKVLINSIGGDMYSCFAIYDMLRTSGAKVTTTGVGIVASGAALIYLAGDRRVTMPNTRFMFHSVNAFGIEGAFKDVQIEVEETKILTSMMAKVFTERTGNKKSKLFDRNRYLSSQEAIALGVATEVYGE